MIVRGAVRFEISHNGQQYSMPSSACTYTFYGPTAIASVDPTAGPAAAHAFVVSAGFLLSGGSDYRCKFGNSTGGIASYRSEKQVACRSPLLPSAIATFEISLNAQQYTRSNLIFYVVAPSRLEQLSPSTGSATGGTIVTVKGSYFRSFVEHPTMCRFGLQLAVATLSDETALRCVSPAATAATLAMNGLPEFVISGVDTKLLGSARIAQEQLELTPRRHFRTGAFILGLVPRSRPFRWFRLITHIRNGIISRSLQANAVGIGVSFNFGMLPTAPFGELGAGPGLRLCFLAQNSTLVVFFAFRLLTRAVLPSMSEITRLELQYTRETLLVLVDSKLVLTLVALPLDDEGTK